MQLQKFKASTTKQALAKVKKALGANALVLETTKTNNGVEILAADASSLDSNLSDVTTNSTKEYELSRIEQLEKSNKKLQQEVELIKQALIQQSSNMLPSINSLSHEMLALGFNKELMHKLFAKVKDISTPASIISECKLLLEARFNQLEQNSFLQTNKAAKLFIGVSGAGKTTCLLKQALQLFQEGKIFEIADLNQDTFKSTQIKHFCNLLGVKYTYCSNVDVLNRLLSSNFEHEILIDTPSLDLSSKDFLLELSNNSLVESCLVVSCEQDFLNLYTLLGSDFSLFDINNAILTKVDTGSNFFAVISFILIYNINLTHSSNSADVTQNLNKFSYASLLEKSFAVLTQNVNYSFDTKRILKEANNG